jgi:hypothetical protein
LRLSPARIAILLIALITAALVAGCGSSDSGSSEDPQQVIDETFNNDTKVTSGDIGFSLNVSAEGSQGGDFTASIDGPFQTDPNNTNAFPQLDLTAKIQGSGGGQNVDFSGGVTATQDQAFVTFQNQAYEIPASIFSQFKTAYEAQANQATGSQSSGSSILSDLGIDPKTWLTNVTNEGTEDVEGTSTIHVSGDADVPTILSDLGKIAQNVPNASAQFDPSQLSQAANLVHNPTIDLYSGADDHLLRKLDVALDVTPPAGSAQGVTSVHVELSITLSGVNETQTISAPSNPKPFSELQQQLGGLGILGSTLGGSGTGSSIGSGSAPSSASSAAYTRCVLQAQANNDAAGVNKCLALLK